MPFQGCPHTAQPLPPRSQRNPRQLSFAPTQKGATLCPLLPSCGCTMHYPTTPEEGFLKFPSRNVSQKCVYFRLEKYLHHIEYHGHHVSSIQVQDRGTEKAHQVRSLSYKCRCCQGKEHTERPGEELSPLVLGCRMTLGSPGKNS